jgi:four helix bundle protein
LTGEIPVFGHERLDVYRAALEFVVLAHAVCVPMPASDPLRDQLTRASASIALNIAEGAGRRNGTPDARRFYLIARGSATECAALIDVLHIQRRMDENTRTRGKQMLVRIVAMLTKM